jgi:phthalate 4,5-dioxygenase oxygenase subunit
VLDSAHSNYLHSTGIKPQLGLGVTEEADVKVSQFGRPSNDGAPKLEAEVQPYGFRYAALRRPLVDPDKYVYGRVTLFVAPIYAIFPAPKGWASMQMFMPIDDEHTMFYYVMWKRSEVIDAATRERYLYQHGMRVGIDMDAEFRKIRTRENNWLQDRDVMARGESFSGIFGINVEDFAVQESMGPICDRTREHLGASDVAVAMFRRVMLRSVEAFQRDGTLPIGLAEPYDPQRLASGEGMLPHGTPWQALMQDEAKTLAG